jgi:hypothetical protein
MGLGLRPHVVIVGDGEDRCDGRGLEQERRVGVVPRRNV